MSLKKSAVVLTYTTWPPVPAPPVVPFCPIALTEANPWGLVSYGKEVDPAVSSITPTSDLLPFIVRMNGFDELSVVPVHLLKTELPDAVAERVTAVPAS